mmetsp:Transcript_39307/g.76932  ORF Transcript_39307/g.76932 Transcript_39307/m.76932 type:complete len:355 (-) Transcript_39307:330-1394(-)|eukprot:CAMPEP_0173388568 /NCGR_PEP_ID=MMETSP1356-20130122/10840_1 /TAXON_ID=77927 ORGANISM="Hemiselmis virescens, Strain PCC157" /NCGR_SAMPLE_ID=MMETSP1356 /ASSEMBLY_ACC=CAM_ASM_000847 /LENGTH=354 /DNA_ID=CAMNT_0014345511 /DNA_START=135 /DNA_END=1199 /DNA_ORIENTATION=+
MGFSCLGFSCCLDKVEPIQPGAAMISQQLDEVIGKLRKRGGGKEVSGEAVNRNIAHCIESDLSPGEQLAVLEALEFTKLCELDIALMERHVGATLLVIQAMMAAIVPILIPFSEVYKDEVMGGTVNEDGTISGGSNVGAVLSIVATSCSLLGSICMAIEKARKFQETSYVGHDAAWAIYKEISLFMSLAGPYKEFDHHKGAAWKLYAENMSKLEQERDARKNNVYGASNAGAGVEVGKAEANAAAGAGGGGGGFPGMPGMPGMGGIPNPMSMVGDAQAAAENMKNQAQGQLADAQQQARDAANNAQQQAQDAGAGAISQAQNAGNNAVSGAQDAAGGAVSQAQGAARDAADNLV